MGVDDNLLPETLGAGGADIVHAQSVNHGGADVTGHAAQGGEGHDQNRQRQIVQLIENRPQAGVAGARGLDAHDREPLERHAEEPDKEQCDDIDGDGVAHDGQHLHGIIQLAPLAHRADDAQRDGDGQGQNGDEDIDEDGVDHPRRDDLHHILLEVGGVAHIPLEQTPEGAGARVTHYAHPPGIAHQDGIVQSHFRAQLLIHLFILLRLERFLQSLQLGAGGIVGNQVIETIHQEGYDQEYQDHIEHTLQNVFLHQFPSYLQSNLRLFGIQETCKQVTGFLGTKHHKAGLARIFVRFARTSICPEKTGRC